MDEDATRRRLLRYAGAAAAVGLAGCSGVADDEGEGNRDGTGTLQSPSTPTDRTGAPGTVRFTSVPDLFNADVPYPMPGWEDALTWFLDRLKSEGPAFTLVPGDIMDARWWESRKQVRLMANAFWGGYVRRFADHDITLYPAVGDHEIGDDEWDNEDTYGLVPTFERMFARHFDTPLNGPAGYEGLAYAVETENMLLLTVDTFEYDGDRTVDVDVSGTQLEWVRRTLADNQDKDFVVVQGHVPVLRPVTSRHSSALYLQGGRDSEFWQAMREYDVDAYLCGEHHAITVTEADGVWQVAHGALWGTHSPVNYLVGAVNADRMRLELKRFDLEYGGGKIHQMNRPKPFVRARVAVPEETRENGPRSAGKVVLGADGDVRTATGVFDG